MIKKIPYIVLFLALNPMIFWGLWQFQWVKDRYYSYRYPEYYYIAPRATEANLGELRQRVLADMAYIASGEFDMGYFYLDQEVGPGEITKDVLGISRQNIPNHHVRLSGYYLSKYEITHHDFDLFKNAVEHNTDFTRQDFFFNSDFDYEFLYVRGPEDWFDHYIKGIRGVNYLDDNIAHRRDYYLQSLRDWPRRPALMAWDEADAYCRWLGELTGLPFSLPTEAQWEFAARSRGRAVAYATHTGNLMPGVNMQPWNTVETRERSSRTHAVDRHPPNPLGLHEMSGNVLEWVLDWYSMEAYQQGTVLDPQGPAEGAGRVVRGDVNPDFISTVRRSLIENHSLPQIDDMITDEVLDQRGIGPRLFGARCAINVSEPPEQSGFGIHANEVPEDYPEPLTFRYLYENSYLPSAWRQ